MNEITPRDLYELREQGNAVDVIDVRTPLEFQEVHLSQARNVPLDKLDPQRLLADRNGSSGNPLYVICNSGNRSRKACEKFRASGFDDVVDVAGGTNAWVAAGLPVERGKKAISLERQVRIAAGALVLAGVVLGYTVHPGFFALAGFIGAGLIFAGVTDTCGMGMLIANLHARQDRTHEEFSTRFADFTSPHHRKAFKSLFHPDPDQTRARAA